MSRWANLPNAEHIDHVVASWKADPGRWIAVNESAWDTARRDTRRLARGIIQPMSMSQWMSLNTVRWPVKDAVLALVAWDNCAHLLDSEPDEVKLLAKLGVPAAILLYPACITLNSHLTN